MKTLNYPLIASKNEFATFLSTVLLDEIQSYRFDMFYDISNIITTMKAKQGHNDNVKQVDIYHLMVRSTGCDMVRPNDESYKTYKSRTAKIYELTFVWNSDYFYGVEFCTINVINK